MFLLLASSLLLSSSVCYSTPCLSVSFHPLSVTPFYVIKFSISLSAGHLFLFCNLESGASGEDSPTSHYPAPCIPGILFSPLQCSLKSPSAKALLPVTMGLSILPRHPDSGPSLWQPVPQSSLPWRMLGIFKDYRSREWGGDEIK